jgi:DNA-binding Lrp family transcriptional regulator
MIVALTFLKVAKGKLAQVVEELSGMDKVKSVTVLTGDYDAIVELEVKEPAELYNIWIEKMDNIAGINETNTHIIVKKVEL